MCVCVCRFSPHKKQHAHLRRSQKKETAFFVCLFYKGKFMNGQTLVNIYIRFSRRIGLIITSVLMTSAMWE